MILIAIILIGAPIAATIYWIGRAVSFNQLLRAGEAAKGAESEDALVDLRTGEVFEPGTRKHARAVKTGKVVFK